MPSPATDARIFPICSRAVADAALADGVYRAPSLASEAFIHRSRVQQVVDLDHFAARFLP